MFLHLLACSDANVLSKAEDYEYAGESASTTGAPQDDGAEDTGFDGEEEDDYKKLAPAATDVYVFVANPDRDTVTRIAVDDLGVLTTEVGKIPSTVVTTADYGTAVTLNEGSDSVSIIDADTMEVTEVGIRDNCNRLELSSDGDWVIAWYDPDKESLGLGGGATSFNEVTFVSLATMTAAPMAVGFSPHSVRWTRDGSRAVVVSDAALAVVDLESDPPSPTLVVLDEEGDAPTAEEVELSPDGNWAFVRQEGSDSILVVSLDDFSISSVAADEGLSDLDLSPDGGSLAAVARTAKRILRYDPASPFDTPEVVDFPFDLELGSLQFTGDGSQGVLYTNASLIDAFAVWDVATGEMDDRAVVKPIQSVALAEDGDSVILFHTLADAADADPEDVFYGEWALTMTDLSSGIQNPILLDAEPTAWSVSEDGAWGFTIMETRGYLIALDYATLLHDNVELPSLPVYLGTMPGRSEAWVSQDHSLGRISFYEPDQGLLDTITGFELNGEIDHE